MPGPVPKPEAEKRHRVKPPIPVDHVPAGAKVVWAPPAEHWNEMATGWYLGLAKSGQAVFYAQSDANLAVIAAEVLTRALNQGARPSPTLIGAFLDMSGRLLSTEGDRRRMRIELARAGVDEAAPAKNAVSAVADLRGKLSAVK